MKKITSVHVNSFGDPTLHVRTKDGEFLLKVDELVSVLNHFNFTKYQPRKHIYLTKPKLKKVFGNS